MKADSKLVVRPLRSSLQQVGIEGVLMTLSPLPIMLLSLNTTVDRFSLLDFNISTIIALLASISLLSGGFLILRHTLTGKFFTAVSLVSTFFISTPHLLIDPFSALFGLVILIGVAFYLFDFKATNEHREYIISTSQSRSIQRVYCGIITIPLILLCRISIEPYSINTNIIMDGALTLSAIIVQLIFLHSASHQKKRYLCAIWTILSLLSIVVLIINFVKVYNIISTVIISNLIILIAIPPSKIVTENYEQWWEMFLNHPARLMLTTFMGLCITGTILLSLPIASEKNVIGVIDAAFTSVSAVCVTGLIVLDTPNDFTIFGQLFILILIQLGGLGIMSITTVGMHAMGRRLTLRQERLMTTITDTYHKDLIQSLISILKFTFLIEVTGATILSLLFYNAGDNTVQALWRGCFTAISAFCNAGFALQSDNLVSYQNHPLILHTVASLIILGGIAPATTVLIPDWIMGKSINVAAYIALVTTAILLISGMLLFLLFDWNGVLAELSFTNKFHNAWFQSATLRTAGFNSVDIASVTDPTFIIMLFLMFIGGSPGGTAGGIKTTTIGIIALTFWSNITNHKSVVVMSRRIQSRVIYRAITITVSGALIWFVIVLMLEVTQQISLRDIIFEVTSALGTVGLSTGATMKLDEIGKIMIMITMFAGRIGPITLFMLLSEERSDNSSRYQNAKISLT